MTEREISTILMALKNICKKYDSCYKCEIYNVCHPLSSYSNWSSNDIKLTTDVLKTFIDEKEK